MKEVLTKDGSYTCYNEDFKENYHSVSGAFEEAFKKYIEPCGVKDGFKILDVCFGLGYNTCAALDTARNLKIVCLEYDKKVLKELQSLKIPQNIINFEIIKKVAKNFVYKDENYDIKLILGDARQTIQEVGEKFDAIFLDPFSTRKNPELWTLQFFKELRRCLKDEGILATYSSSIHVRAGLLEAGFNLSNGPIVGRTMPSTLAVINRKLVGLPKKDLELVRTSGRAFMDNETLTLKKDEILKNSGGL